LPKKNKNGAWAINKTIIALKKCLEPSAGNSTFKKIGGLTLRMTALWFNKHLYFQPIRYIAKSLFKFKKQIHE
jgi:hypothetical protein